MYNNYTGIAAPVVALGSNYPLSVKVGQCGSFAYSGYVGVWIDYNQDGDFADAGELVFSKTASKTTPVSGTFTIPTTATLGATRVRVSLKYNAIPTSCGSFTYGQVEDYTVNIVTTAREDIHSVSNTIAFKLYPIPVRENFLNISGLEKESTFKIFNLLGQELTNGKINNNVVDLSRIAAGNYIIEVSNQDGVKAKHFTKE
mgnify:CR=1 FL=1